MTTPGIAAGMISERTEDLSASHQHLYPTVLAARRRRYPEARVAYLLILPALAFLLFTYGYSIIALVSFSLHQRGRGQWVGLDNYRLLFGDRLFRLSLTHNLALVATVPVIIGLSVIVASMLHERVRGWKIYRLVLFLPNMLPVVVAGIAFGFIFEKHGMLNAILHLVGLGALSQDWLGDSHFALPAVASVIVWRQAGFGVVLLLARMVQIPLELYESVRLEGANWWQTLCHVTIPQVATIIAFYAGLLVIELFAWVINYIIVLTKGGPGFSTYVSEYFIYDRAFGYDQMGIASAFSVVLLTTVLIGMYAYFSWLRRRDVF
jgi:ABC-type sugar transport system permease subunit